MYVYGKNINYHPENITLKKCCIPKPCFKYWTLHRIFKAVAMHLIL